ncbi:conserved hypothetical protein [Hyphomicrobiales bacterium]|jgi:hypothetical protein|nr:conserved hypothetical protein [Hyphomicrobiales bacterium]CAH1675227.1 conserved hypothetical protein [Hyphomicrobiales bacterium]
MINAPWQTRAPDLVADVRLYTTQEGGRTSAALLGYGCPCFTSKDLARGGWDARLQLGDEPFEPGTQRRVGFVFLTPEGADAIRRAGRFYLFETRFVGEGTVIS